ncbi:MAG TPA: hypothetical protein ENL03_03825 [Phycisphaerae bacterium]|nr:hypothetical protein [Phycisphaerae bacterium]
MIYWGKSNLVLPAFVILAAACLTGCGNVKPEPHCIGPRLLAGETLEFTVAPYADCTTFPPKVESVSVLADGEVSNIAVSITPPAGPDQSGPLLRLEPPQNTTRLDVIIQITQASRRFVMIVSFIRLPEDSRWQWQREDEQVVDLGKV